jgi:hypothetical protein|tara:strand:+ start:1348 stop:1581 length:234 start_codon:yes stop_codon:yes gene_type:complete
MSHTWCPICGGEIQSSEKQYWRALVLSDDCKDIEDQGTACDYWGDGKVYCENDHTQQDMIDHLAKKANNQTVPPEEV